MSVEAPERIWADEPYNGCVIAFARPKAGFETEYVRIDKLEELAAELIQSRNYWSEDVSKTEAALAEAHEWKERVQDLTNLLDTIYRIANNVPQPSKAMECIRDLAKNKGGSDVG